MDGDPRNQKMSLLRKYDIPIDNISYEYVEKCTDKKILERIIRILRSGEEGFFPDLLRVTEDRLRLFAPDSRVLRLETPILTKESFSKDEWNGIENELLSWEEEMKVIDKSLDFEKGRIDVVGNKNMPTIRKVPETLTKAKSNEKKQMKQICKNDRIKSGDYAAWDKFDVDKELLKIDVEEERKEEENQKKKREIKKAVAEKTIEVKDVNKESYSKMEQLVLANQAKDRGNECYKSGDLKNALKYYNLSIKLSETTNAYNNRAMTYLKLKQYGDAVSDCNVVLSKESNNVKALHRRATAYQNMADEGNKYDMLALRDLNEIIHLEPNNKVVQAELHKLKKKLGIDDIGKKFRMAIHESGGSDSSYSGSKDNKLVPYVQEPPVNVDKLPLTYYGPSTSTFQCEPYSMAHRALLGSFLSTEVMCKCNSNRPRQNPLCQRCGEAVSKPKPSPAKTVTSKVKSEPNVKAINQAKNLEKQKSESASSKKEEVAATTTVKNGEMGSEKKAAEVAKAKKEVSNEVATTRNNHTKERGVKGGDNRTGTADRVGKEESKSVGNDKTRQENAVNASKISQNVTNRCLIEEIGSGESQSSSSTTTTTTTTTTATTVANGAKSVEESSQGPDGRKHSNKSKNKRKKKVRDQNKDRQTCKQLELIEPLKVVHASKYLHPTSVEPKVSKTTTTTTTPTTPAKDSEREPAYPPNNQFKAFVPNRQCLSVQRDDPTKRLSTVPCSGLGRTNVPDSGRTGSSSPESDKENVSTGANAGGGDEKRDTRNGPVNESKLQVLESAFEFVKAWEEVKKSDESYERRAQIIRLIRPGDLGKVIGIKLDSDMLSSILECLEKHFVETDPQIVVDFLKQLPQVPRFGLIKMFLADADKKVMRNLIATAEVKGFTLEEDTKRALAVNS